MSAQRKQVKALLQRLLAGREIEQTARSLLPDATDLPGRIPGASHLDPRAVDLRWKLLPPIARAILQDGAPEAYQRNIENFIGTLKVPIGIAGPLRVNGLFASGDYYIPLATTEAALVASYDRGARLLTEAGGCAALLLNEGISRAPAFAFPTAALAGRFILWVTEHFDQLSHVAKSTTTHGELVDLRITLEGNHVYLNFEFRTGDAAGQNMVTIATQALCAYIEAHTPVKPDYWFVEGNLSGDKKSTAQSFMTVRGKKVTADVTLPADLVKKRLHTTPDAMAKFWGISAMGAVLSGCIGVQGHYANGLAALYLACGQDVACVAESAVGVTRMELRPDGALYACVTLPNLVVGTVGGGTGLPSQQACLEILGLAGPGHAQALAEVAAAVALAGELSIVGALAAGEFTRAHARLARGKRQPSAPGGTPTPPPEGGAGGQTGGAGTAS